MRRLLLLPLLLCSLSAFSQTVDTSTYTRKMDYLFQNLSKTPVTTGILYDRVYPAARLDLFNQGTRQDTSSYSGYVQAHSELYTAHYTTPTATLPATAPPSCASWVCKAATPWNTASRTDVDPPCRQACHASAWGAPCGCPGCGARGCTDLTHKTVSKPNRSG